MAGGHRFGRLDDLSPLQFDENGRLTNEAFRLTQERMPSRLRAVWQVTMDGQNVTDRLDPFLIRCTVIDKVDEADVCQIELDDRYGRIQMPGTQAPVHVALGWPDEGVKTVFEGSISDVESAAQKSSGRLLMIEATGAQILGDFKSKMSMEFGDGEKEDITFEKALQEFAGKIGGSVTVDPVIGNIKRKYWAIPNESPMEWISRMAHELGGVAKFQGNNISISQRSQGVSAKGEAMPHVRCVAGQNMLAWRIRPIISRAMWGKTGHLYWDRQKADMALHDKDVSGLGSFGQAVAQHIAPMVSGSEGAATTAAGADAGTSTDKQGTGWVVIDGEPGAQAGGTAEIIGARPGVDNTYAIKEVEHSYHRGGGYTCRLDLDRPGLSVTQPSGQFPG